MVTDEVTEDEAGSEAKEEVTKEGRCTNGSGGNTVRGRAASPVTVMTVLSAVNRYISGRLLIHTNVFFVDRP